jgi:hypothetical protein
VGVEASNKGDEKLKTRFLMLREILCAISKTRTP